MILLVKRYLGLAPNVAAKARALARDHLAIPVVCSMGLSCCVMCSFCLSCYLMQYYKFLDGKIFQV